MFEKPWRSVRDLLLTGVCLMAVLAPYEAESAPKNRGRSERLSKRARREAERQNRQRQRQQRQNQRRTPRPTLEERLSPAQVARKIQTFRRRIETASEQVISSQDKIILLEAFDDIVQTPMGRYTFEKAHPNLNFCVRPMSSAASYGNGNQCISISKRDFDDIRKAKTPAEKAALTYRIAGCLVHEATHSIQYVNNMNDRRNMSFEEGITIYKLYELHSALHEEVARYQMSCLPKYRTLLQEHTSKFTPLHRFYGELFEAYRATGMTEERAHRSARTKFVETCWGNRGQAPIQIGDRTIYPTTSNASESIDSWNTSYNFYGFTRTVRRDVSSREAMRDRGIERQVRRFIRIMEIDTPPSFFRDSKTSAFDMPSSRRLIGYVDGIRNRELDILTTGFISKGYENGKLNYISITTHQKPADRQYTEYYEGTRLRKSTYTYRDGKMNGVYREYDRQGRQIIEIPIQNDEAHGEGWAMEGGKRVPKVFRRGYFMRGRTRE